MVTVVVTNLICIAPDSGWLHFTGYHMFLAHIATTMIGSGCPEVMSLFM